jgi:hypothetical protein
MNIFTENASNYNFYLPSENYGTIDITSEIEYSIDKNETEKWGYFYPNSGREKFIVLIDNIRIVGYKEEEILSIDSTSKNTSKGRIVKAYDLLGKELDIDRLPLNQFIVLIHENGIKEKTIIN